MGQDKKGRQSPNRFQIGTHGGCEASLFEFSEKHIPKPHIVRVAAVNLDQALAYLHWHEPEFEIESVQNLGLILMVSGSPID
jgi:hypothetical protein